MTTKKQKYNKPPSLLGGLFSLTLLLTGLILVSGWLIINYQIEQLVAQRTSEYAHSIAQIAANSAADPLMSDDKIQLKLLVENVAKDPYIRSATVFAEDGQVVAQYPENLLQPISIDDTSTEPSITTTSDATSPQSSDNSESFNGIDNAQEITNLSSNSTSAEEELLTEPAETSETTKRSEQQLLAEATSAYLQSQTDIPFVEKITYQQVTAGWFKITLNRQLLESNFREALTRSQQIILAIAVVLFCLLLLLTLKYTRRIKQLTQYCHRLIQINAPLLPNNTQQWLDAVKALANNHIHTTQEKIILPEANPQWLTSRRAKGTLFCFCQFSMVEQNNEQTAKAISLGEQYLKAAIQTHGLQSQGNILSGCLIPFLDAKDNDEALEEAINLVYLIKELFASIDVEIKLRAFIGKATILVLENERAVISGISLSNRMLEKINKLSPQVAYGDIICLGVEQQSLNPLGQFVEKPLPKEATPSVFYTLLSVDESVKQQTARQLNYIISNYCAS
ncbi:hypothetical protein [Aliikangiella maris]|uniref:Uncharacterized protein n=2 Tax=Aliikangiella maris TaxID=3162458 RepID=A0ABV3MQ92_9GAMM